MGLAGNNPRRIAVFDNKNILVAANRAYLAVFDGLEMVRPGIHMAALMALLSEEGIVDTGGMKAADWQNMMLARLDSHRIDPAVLKIWNGTYVKLIERRTRDGDLVTLALNITDQIEREEQLKEAGINEVWIVVNHQKEIIQNYFKYGKGCYSSWCRWIDDRSTL